MYLTSLYSLDKYSDTYFDAFPHSPKANGFSTDDLGTYFYKDVLNLKLGKVIQVFTDYVNEVNIIEEKNSLDEITSKINVIMDLRENIKFNNLDNNIFISDVYSNVNDKYNYIVTNPPIRAGKYVVLSILKERETTPV